MNRIFKGTGVQSKIFDFCERHSRPRECRLFYTLRQGKKALPIFCYLVSNTNQSDKKYGATKVDLQKNDAIEFKNYPNVYGIKMPDGLCI